MVSTSPQDIQSSISNTVRMQLALLDLSVNYWQTLFGQSVAYTELWSQSMQSVQSGEPQFTQNLQRLVELGLRSTTELGKLAADFSNAMIEIADNSNSHSSDPNLSGTR